MSSIALMSGGWRLLGLGGVDGIHATKQAVSEKRKEKKIERGNASSRMDDASHRTLTQSPEGPPHTYICLA